MARTKGKTTPNRKYKDSVFVDLFSQDKNAKANFISLYNALHGRTLALDTDLVPLRLERTLYMGFYNDVSCLVDNKIIVMAEHQSTINENMPLRFLEYVARLYEQLQNPRDKYLRRLMKIPFPEFYVFYNGQEDLPSNQKLKLSDAFMVLDTEINLDLTVQVININHSKRHELLARCRPLAEYSLFVETVRRHIKADKEHGFENAIKECLANNILKEYLQRKTKEVMNMLVAEYDYATDIEVQREEERKIALQEGMQQGMQEGEYRKALDGARNLKQLGVDILVISQAIGLSIEEIERL